MRSSRPALAARLALAARRLVLAAARSPRAAWVRRLLPLPLRRAVVRATTGRAPAEVLYDISATVAAAAAERPLTRAESRLASAVSVAAGSGSGSGSGAVVYLPTIAWGYLFQRPQQVVRAMARVGRPAFFCTPEPGSDGVKGLRPVEERLWLCPTPRPLRVLEAPVVWLNWPVNRHWLGQMQRPVVVYDVIDELEIFDLHCERMERDHRALLEEADLVVASATRLAEGVAGIRPDVLLAPNAVHPGDLADPGPVPDDMAAVLAAGRPVVGYVGAVARWFDFDLFGEVVRACPDLSFVVVGPDYDGSAARLPRAPNLHVLGARPYERLPGYLHRFDVGVIPFVVDTVTRSTSPVKLFEYLAAGLPVVATPMDECRGYGRAVALAADPTAFAAALREAVAARHDPAFAAEVVAHAAANTWDSRVQAVLARLGARA